MQLYLDSSALVKLVVHEPESEPLRDYLGSFDDVRFSAALSRTELIRAITRTGAAHDVLARAHRMLGRLNLVVLSTRLLDEAAMLGPPGLRTLDAIHLAAARTAPALRALITYDTRLAEAADSLGMRVATPV
jgi:predicted nucleic acid-binding protein